MARGAAERRLRDSAVNNGRPRVQITAGDRLRDAAPASGGVFGRQVEASLWSGRAAGDAPTEPILSETMQSQSPDVELLEPESLLVKEEKVEANMSHVDEAEEDVRLIGDDGVLECASRGAAAQRPPFQHQESQIQSGMKRRTDGGGRGVEKSEEPDVVLVKVEEVEPAVGASNQTGLSIQEGLVESSTDNYQGVLPFDETTQTSSNHLSDLQESGRGFSEVSYGHSSLWTNGGVSYEDGVPGPSSHCAPLSYVSEAMLGSERERAPEGEAAGESPPSFSTFPFEQQLTVIDLSGESGSPPASAHQRFVDPGPSQGQKGTTKKLCVCSFCGKGFRSPANLESHMRTHTGERPYGCTICGKKFSQFWNLKIHRNIHTGERPYQCLLCPERFSDPSNLKKHQKRHHPQDRGNPPATA
ncbi:unnamed protein product [Ophioblennius macclurei]